MSCFISSYNTTYPKERVIEPRVNEVSVRMEEHCFKS